MSDTPYKQCIPAKVRKPGSAALTSWPASAKREPFGAALASQDTIFNAARLLACVHTGGSAEWLVDNTATGGGAQAFPSPTAWRTAARARFELGPGQAIDFRCLAVPSGTSETFVTSLGTWQHYGSNADIRVVVSYLNLNVESASVTVQRGLPASVEALGIENLTAGKSWQLLQHHFAGSVRPQVNTLEETNKWSEWPTVTVAIEHRGGARVIAASLTESPREHVSTHNFSGVTLHDYSLEQGGQHPTLWPQTKIADGATYSDYRFGVTRGLEVASRQSQRMGPIIASWTSYAERLAEPTDTEADAVAVTSTTFVGLSIGAGVTTWNANAPGYDVPACYARRAPENLTTRLEGTAAIPVRVWVYGRCATGGAGTWSMRFASSARSSVTISIARSNTDAWYTTTGWLEGPVSATDSYALLQDFAKVSGAFTAEPRYWLVEFCDWLAAV